MLGLIITGNMFYLPSVKLGKIRTTANCGRALLTEMDNVALFITFTKN